MLNGFQDGFIRAVMDPLLPTPVGLVNPEGNCSDKRFNVYRNNVITGLLGALSDAFPIVEKLVGADFFREMARIYVRNFPPKSPLMMFYGDDFPDFIQRFEPARTVPYLCDIARLEYTRRLAYFAADMPVISLGAFQDIGPERLPIKRLILHPALHILKSPYPIFDIWHKNQNDPEHPILAIAQEVLITRSKLEVEVVNAPLGTSDFIAQLKNKAKFGDAIEATLKQIPDAAIDQIIALTLPHVIALEE